VLGLNHSGKGDFTASVFDLNTKTNIEKATIKYNGITYLSKANTQLNAVINADINNQKYVLKQNNLTVNALVLNLDGFLQLNEKDIDIDFSFNTPTNKFKDLLSILPNAYTQDFTKVKADGNFDFNGTVKGKYIAMDEIYPSFVLNLNIDNGNFKYPDLPIGITDINTKTNIRNAGGSLDATVVDVSQFELKIEKDLVKGFLKLTNPISDPTIDSRISGNLDLANFAKAYPLDGVKELAGRVMADITAKAKQSDVEKENYNDVNIAGQLNLQNILYITHSMPIVNIKNSTIQFSPQSVDIKAFNANLGKSDINASGKIYNLLAYFSQKGIVRGNLDITSNYFLADEWLVSEEDNTPLNSQPKKDELVSDQYNLNFNANFRKLDYDTYKLSDLNTKFNITANNLQLEQFYTRVNGSDVSAVGKANNLYNFVYNNGVLNGDFKLSANLFDLDKLMAVEENKETTEATVTPIPDYRYNINADLIAKTVIYSPYKLTNLTGNAHITEKMVDIKSFNTNIFDGDLSGSGKVSNYLAYVFANDTIIGDFNIQSNFLNVNAVLASPEYTANIGNTTPTVAQPEDLEAYILPSNWDFRFKGNLNKVLYTDMDIQKMTGDIIIQDGILLFENVKGDLLGGKITVTGGYDTSNPSGPKMDIKLWLNEIAISSAFKTFNTFKALAPIAGFLDGKFNATLLFSSVLGKDMMPDLSTINAEGFIQTFNAVIKGFKPLQEVGNQLQSDVFQEIPLNDTKNWFTVKNGMVFLEDATINAKDISMKINGTHGLNQEMNYKIIALVPRDKMGKAANKGLNLLEAKAQQSGLNIALGTHIKMQINLSGDILNPKVNIIPLGSETGGSLQNVVEETVQQKVDDLKQEAKDEVNQRIAQERAKIDTLTTKAIDSAKTIVRAQIDSVRNEAKDRAREVIDDKTKEIQEHLDKYNPFKRKKGN
jgi:vacuolar-type H+-ATPase subunit H